MARKPFSTVAIILPLLFFAGVSLYVAGEMPHSTHAALEPPANHASTQQEPTVPPPAIAQVTQTLASASKQQASATVPVATAVAPIVAPPGAELHTIAKG